MSMDLPDDVNLPFFAYGIFRKGELGYLSIADLVEEIDDAISMPGCLYLRDGLPVLDISSEGTVSGTLIFFKPDSSREAYERIIGIEPEKQYRWDTVHFHQMPCNCLAGIEPKTGSVGAEEGWNGRGDLLFTVAIEVIKETMKEHWDFKPDLKPTFRLQMAYLLLWSAIERYASLRYRLGGGPTSRVNMISEDPVFADLLRSHVTRTDSVQRADKPTKGYTLDRSDPSDSLDYYYQIRCNITHRGKSVRCDHPKISNSLCELLSIFSGLLTAAFDESEQAAP